MTHKRTLAIIKPNAVKKNVIGEIITEIEGTGLIVIGAKMLSLTDDRAKMFYVEHADKPFYGELVQFMTSGPVVVLALQGEDAIQRYRKLMGPTRYWDGPEYTLRSMYADSLQHNAVHGSDSETSAQREIAFFFNDEELCPRLS